MNSLRIKAGVDITKIPNLPCVLRLMMGEDALRAAVRWLFSFANEDTTIARTDRIIAMVVVSGWTGELIHLIKEGSEKSWISREMLRGEPDIEATWDDCLISPRPSLVIRMLRLRDKCFAHWDPDIAKAYIQKHTEAALAESFMEWDPDPDAEEGWLHACYPWAQGAIAKDIDPGDEQLLRELVHEMGVFQGRISRLVERLVAVFCRDHDFLEGIV